MGVVLWLVFISFFLACSAAQLRNDTVDDTRNSISYNPSHAWRSSAGSTCDGCLPKNIDISRVHRTTWHEGRSASENKFEVIASFKFSGVAVYVECILALTRQPTLGRSNMVFLVDGNFKDRFEQTPVTAQQPPEQVDFEYHQVVFAAQNLSTVNQDHVLTIQVLHGDEPDNNSSVILLDSITYSYYDNPEGQTTDIPSTTSNSLVPTELQASQASMSTSGVEYPSAQPSTSAARIAGSVLGALALIIFIALGLLVYCRRRQGRPILPSFTKPSDAPREGANLTRSYTFNPSLLVRARELAKKASNPSLRHTKRRPTPLEGELYPNMNSSTMDLRHSAVIPDSGAMYSANDRLLSIQSWRNHAQREIASTPTPIGPLDPSEELSSYYEDATEAGKLDVPPPPHGMPPRPPRPTVKRWAVMNK